MTRVTVSPDPQHEGTDAPAAHAGHDSQSEIIRLAALVAQLTLLIDEVELAGNMEAALSLRVQYHQATADLLALTQQLEVGADPRTAELRQRHERKAAAYRAELSRRGP